MFVDRQKKQKIFPERFSNTNYPWNSFTFLRNSCDDFRVLKISETVLQRLKIVRILGVWGSATVQYFYSDEHTYSEIFLQRSTRPEKFKCLLPQLILQYR